MDNQVKLAREVENQKVCLCLCSMYFWKLYRYQVAAVVRSSAWCQKYTKMIYSVQKMRQPCLLDGTLCNPPNLFVFEQRKHS